MLAQNNVIVRQVCTSSSRKAGKLDCRSTPRIAFTVRLATSRTRRRTSTGWSRKAVEAPIIRICKTLPMAIAALLAGAPAGATVPSLISDPARAYIAARAAAISGNHVEAAEIYARLASRSDNKELEQRAI